MFASRKKQEEPQQQIDAPPPVGVPRVDFSVNDNSGAGIKGKMAVNRRRFNEKLGQKMGKEGTDDADFEDRHRATQDLHFKVCKVRDSMKALLDATRAMSQRAVDLSNACGDADARDQDFITTQLQLDQAMRSMLDDSVGKALDSLDRKLAPFKELDERVKTRNNLKLDYDHYVRKVRELKEKSGADASKIANNEMKLEAARVAVHKATLSVYKAFNYYDAVGGRLVAPEVEAFKAAQRAFYMAALNCVKDVPLRDPVQVAAEVDRLGEDGSNRPVATGYDGSYAAASSAHNRQSSGLAQSQGSSSSLSFGGAAAGGGSTYSDPPSTTAPSAPWMTNNNMGGGGGGGAAASAAPTGAWWDQQGAGGGGGGEPNPFGTPVAVAVPMGIAPPPPSQGGGSARALYDYTAHDNTELSLTTGDVIRVMEKHESGWWVGEKAGVRGLFPANYV
ncbi:hypothetical protein JKP88DRAFT_186412, partial [Tribonema minus]